MTALTEDLAIERRDGVLLEFDVAGSETIYGGSLVCVGADGYAVSGADTSGLIFEGVATERVDNSSGADGDKKVELLRRGLFKCAIAAAAIANIGDNVFVVDDQTVGLVATTDNDVFCGIIAGVIDSTHVWVDIEPAIRQADVATHIADVADAHDASAISLADAGGYTDETDVEAALQEIYPLTQGAVADPGDGGAIPVTRSGVCAITTTGVDDTRTLAIPTFIGQLLTISLDVDGGDAVVTVAAGIKQTGENTITMADAGDAITLIGVQVAGGLVWRVLANDGASLSTV